MGYVILIIIAVLVLGCVGLLIFNNWKRWMFIRRHEDH
jgi:hypothetical protein